MRTLCKKPVFTVMLVLASAITAQATPNSGIAMSDHVIATTPGSFFVIRSTTLHPPTYYRYHERVEFVELSIPDGNILQRCVLRETEYLSDAGADGQTWTQTEAQNPACQIFDVLSKRGAVHMTPRAKGEGRFSLRLGADGLDVKDNTSSDTPKWTNAASVKTIKQRAVNTTSIAKSEIPWQVARDTPGVLSLIGTDDNVRPLHEICELDPVATTSRGTDLVFVRLLCWEGNADEDGANFHIVLNVSR